MYLVLDVDDNCWLFEEEPVEYGGRYDPQEGTMCTPVDGTVSYLKQCVVYNLKEKHEDN